MDYQQNKRAQEDRAKAANEIAKSCAVTFDSAESVAVCLVEKMETYRKQAVSDQDLEAQQEMARWTAVMGLVGVIGIPLSTLGLLALWASLRQTRLAINTDRELGHAQVRAYLSIEPISPSDFEVGKKARATLQIKNTGQSPAYEVNYIAGILIFDNSLNLGPGDLIGVDPSQLRQAGVSLAAQGDFIATGYSLEPLTKEVLDAVINSDDKNLYLGCNVFYKDVFGVSRETKTVVRLVRLEDRVPHPRTGALYHPFGWVTSSAHSKAT